MHDTNEDHLLGDEYMAVDTSTLVECEIDGVASVYSELFTNPFLAWGKYRRGLFKTTLPISFQFHHALRGIGVAKTSTYYALAPFIGAFLSVVILGEPIGWIFIVATIVMAVGCWLAGR